MLAYYVEWHLKQKTVECTLESEKYVFDKITRPTELQQKALDLLSISSVCTQ